ncbi:retron Ec78 anti-phage system effector HNH endonuclease PtuB [Vibrio cholerae]|uniref:retron Ec78 anti-phage system effector HNH endonuclease PtuB n=1 Tax=Vibrio cholerae TaxID=666 RepID=UPI000B48F818|nr:retron Ec78 anti-phage system effector HNH endonuclease PtuB [Vibrio cholerae]EGQ9962151.1 TIGR02646 family protein [Vibrio cholerae]EGQ9983372.1 TIGR02646 family protein [Vibrio cholerae]EGR1084660.1 TIGR02646 family protein [Vibrio cholerae]EGR4228728.1 TIGR02646 family protein [Vibrio cholerae]EHD7114046.1 TIGR02646 family protein [Vibrio cholerae]
MKKITKNVEPESLRLYRASNPNDDWKTGFKRNAGQDPNKEVKQALLLEQKHLCVYCEIDLKSGMGYANDDFRVEHFYPENPKDEDKRYDGINYALTWSNMFGCCHGGSMSTVVDKNERFTNPDVSCDVNKKNNDWTADLLNPLTDIPAFPSVFSFDENGNIFVNEDIQDPEIARKASKTIELLSLDSQRLIKLRKNAIDDLIIKINELSGENFSDEFLFDAVLEQLASELLLCDKESSLVPFFSSIRWYLGPAAEKILKQASYNG